MGWKEDFDAASGQQERVRLSEGQKQGYIDYDQDMVNQAIVHSREDQVLIAYELCFINRNLYQMKYALWILILIVGFFGWRFFATI